MYWGEGKEVGPHPGAGPDPHDATPLDLHVIKIWLPKLLISQFKLLRFADSASQYNLSN